MNRQNQCKKKSDPRNFCKNHGWRCNWKEGENIQIRFSIFYENRSKKRTQFIKINKCIKDMMARHMYETNVFDGGYTTKYLSLSHFCCCCWNTVDTYGQLEKSCVMTSVVSGIFFNKFLDHLDGMVDKLFLSGWGLWSHWVTWQTPQPSCLLWPYKCVFIPCMLFQIQ